MSIGRHDEKSALLDNGVVIETHESGPEIFIPLIQVAQENSELVLFVIKIITTIVIGLRKDREKRASVNNGHLFLKRRKWIKNKEGEVGATRWVARRPT